MKRLFTLLFVLTGMFFAQSAFSQTANPKDKKASKKADTTTVTPNAQKASGQGGNQGGGTITIDESGAPKVKAKPSSTATAPSNGGTPPKEEAQKKDNEAAQKSSSDDAPAPSPIAIDESGSVKVKKAPAANATPSNADTTSTVRPQFL
jgi:hypothetical protein